MLSSVFLTVPPPHCLLPLHQPSQSMKEKRKSNVSKRNHKGFTRNLCFSYRDHHSISTKPKNVDSLRVSKQYPGDDFSDFMFIDDQLFNPVLVAAWIWSCYNEKDVRRLHSIAIKCFGGSVTFVDNNLISVYVRFGKLVEARKVFDQMPMRNVVSWTAIFNGYLKMGSEDQVLRFLSELIENGVQPNSKTYVCILNMCIKRLDFELGKQIHACIVKGNWSNLIVDSAILHFYAHFGDLEEGFRVFNRMPERDVICWTTLITACARNGQGKKAFSIFSLMRAEGFSPNEFTVSSVLKACAEEKFLKYGRQLHAAIVKKLCKQDVFVGSSLVVMYAKCEEVKDARMVFDSMTTRNTVTWTSMISCYALNGLGHEAINLFRIMKKRHVYVSESTVVSILQACASVGTSCTGKEIHAQILKFSFRSNIFIGNTLVWFYCKCGKYISAANALKLMPDKDVVSWTAIISGCVQLGHGLEALQFLNEMLWDSVEPNPYTYSSALKACAKQGAVLQGKWIHSSVIKNGTLPNVIVGSALIDMYVKCGCVLEASKVFNNMPEWNFVSWKTMIIGYARNGFCREALQLMYRMQAEGFEMDDYIKTTVLNACGDVEWDLES